MAVAALRQQSSTIKPCYTEPLLCHGQHHGKTSIGRWLTPVHFKTWWAGTGGRLLAQNLYGVASLGSSHSRRPLSGCDIWSDGVARLCRRKSDKRTKRNGQATPRFLESPVYLLESKLRYKSLLNASDRQLMAKLERSGRQPNSVSNGAAERVRSQRGTRERFMHGSRSAAATTAIQKNIPRRRLAGRFGLPPACRILVSTGAKSSAGAVGMWQFTKGAAKTFMPGGEWSYASILLLPPSARPAIWVTPTASWWLAGGDYLL